MKKICKVISIYIIVLILFSFVYTVNASDIWQTGKKFIGIGASKIGLTEENPEILKKLGIDTKLKFKELIDFLWGLGLLTIFIATVILGIKYMLVLPQEKSRIKQATTPYIIGVVIIFGALTIWKTVIGVLDGVL